MGALRDAEPEIRFMYHSTARRSISEVLLGLNLSDWRAAVGIKCFKMRAGIQSSGLIWWILLENYSTNDAR